MNRSIIFILHFWMTYLVCAEKIDGNRCYVCESENGQYITKEECLQSGNIKQCVGRDQVCETRVRVKAGKNGKDLVLTRCENIDNCLNNWKSNFDDCDIERRCCSRGESCHKNKIESSCGLIKILPEPTTAPPVTTPSATTPVTTPESTTILKRGDCQEGAEKKPEHGSRTDKVSGDKIISNFICDEGYCLEGDRITACDQNSGIWNSTLIPTCVERTCYDSKKNVLLIIDQSRTIGLTNFESLKSFIVSVTQESNNVGISIVTFGTYTNVVNDEYQSGQALADKVKENMNYREVIPDGETQNPGQTCMGRGLAKAYGHFENKLKGQGIPEVWLLTDGWIDCNIGGVSNDTKQLQEATEVVQKFRHENIRIRGAAIGPHRHTYEKNLAKLIGSEPVKVENFDALDEKLLEVVSKICRC